MDVAKEVRAEAERLSRLADDIESGKAEAAGFKIQVVNPAGKIVVEWEVTKVEPAGGRSVRYVAGWGSDGWSSGVYARVCGVGAGTL